MSQLRCFAFATPAPRECWNVYWKANTSHILKMVSLKRPYQLKELRNSEICEICKILKGSF